MLIKVKHDNEHVGLLMTRKEIVGPAEFELDLEVRINKRGNSGRVLLVLSSFSFNNSNKTLKVIRSESGLHLPKIETLSNFAIFRNFLGYTMGSYI